MTRLVIKNNQKVSISLKILVTCRADEWLTIVKIEATTTAPKYTSPTRPTFAKKTFLFLDSERGTPLVKDSFKIEYCEEDTMESSGSISS